MLISSKFLIQVGESNKISNLSAAEGSTAKTYMYLLAYIFTYLLTYSES
jgi:hypothetical protein